MNPENFEHFTLFLLSTFSILISLINCKVVTLDNATDVKGNDVIKEIRIMYSSNQTAPVRLTRGVPLFAEVDFVPRYFPSNMNAVTLTVLIPETIRRSRLGGPWIIGWNQERIAPPACRLCTNLNQSYTIPVTVYLPDDGWCPEGPIPTGWKIEATTTEIPTETRFTNSDQTIGMVIDEQAQLSVKNRPESNYCVGIHETIRYQIPGSAPFNQTLPENSGGGAAESTGAGATGAAVQEEPDSKDPW